MYPYGHNLYLSSKNLKNNVRIFFIEIFNFNAETFCILPRHGQVFIMIVKDPYWVRNRLTKTKYKNDAPGKKFSKQLIFFEL